MNYFHMLLDYEYELVKSPAGATQWQPVNQKPEDLAPGAHSPDRRLPTMMTTADMAFKMDPKYRGDLGAVPRQSGRSSPTPSPAPGSSSPTATWGPRSRYLGPEVPAEDLIWQDPIPAVDHPLVDAADVAEPQAARSSTSGLTVAELVQDRLGLGLDLPRLGQARRRQRRAHPPRAAEGLGGQRARRARPRARASTRASRPTSTARRAAARRSRWPT